MESAPLFERSLHEPRSAEVIKWVGQSAKEVDDAG